MSQVLPVASKLKVAVHPNCKDSPTGDGSKVCEYLVYLSVPKAGGDGLLLGVTETEEAAEAIASTLNLVLSNAHNHV